jgi:hypothetical protein
MRIVSLALVVLASSTHNLSGQIPAKLATERVPLVPGLSLPVDAMLRVEHGYEDVAPSGGRTSPNTSSARKIFQKQR